MGLLNYLFYIFTISLHIYLFLYLLLIFLYIMYIECQIRTGYKIQNLAAGYFTTESRFLIKLNSIRIPQQVIRIVVCQVAVRPVGQGFRSNSHSTYMVKASVI